MIDFDSPWKEALDSYFEAFVAFFFPQAHADIDWSRGHAFLDKELQQVVKEAEIGRRVVDKLVQVWRKSGDEEWLLIHIEVQSQVETDFPLRMFVYNYRLFDRYNRKVVSLALLADEQEEWRPDTYQFALWGFRIEFQFPIVKLLDYAARTKELADHLNPFAVVVMAHLTAQATRGDPEDRRRSKLSLVKGLYDHGWSADDVRKLFRFIDWVLELPPDLARSFWEEFEHFEEERNMPFITSVERIGIEKGREEGLLAGKKEGLLEGKKEGLLDAIVLGLELRFPEHAPELIGMVKMVTDVGWLRHLLKTLHTAQNAEEFRAAVARPENGNT